jgi:hypothetical protein
MALENGDVFIQERRRYLIHGYWDFVPINDLRRHRLFKRPHEFVNYKRAISLSARTSLEDDFGRHTTCGSRISRGEPSIGSPLNELCRSNGWL